MKWLCYIITAVCTLAISAICFSAGLPPWEFGMSKSEVSAFTEFGPYRAFPNGDIETFNGIFDGKKENIQFFFDAKGLRRIGVYVYEGKDLDAASEAWQRAYESLERNFGKIETPALSIEPANSEALSIAAAAYVDLFGKIQIAPVDQPKAMFVFSSFRRDKVQGARYFYVIIFFTRHP